MVDEWAKLRNSFRLFEQRAVHDSERLADDLRHQVRVAVARRADVGVAQDLLDHLERHALCDEQRRAASGSPCSRPLTTV